jgi:hypothetical protein
MLSVKETLIKAKSLIDLPEKWIQNTWVGCRNGGDRDDLILLPKAEFINKIDEMCFCLWGSFEFLDGYTDKEYSLGQAKDKISEELFKLNFTKGMIAYNDTPGRTHKEIIDLFDKAIASCE